MDYRTVGLRLKESLLSYTEWQPNPMLTRLYLYLLIPIFVLLLSPVWTPPPGIQFGITLAALLFAFHEYIEKRILILYEAIPQVEGQVDNFSESYGFAIVVVLLDLLIAVPMYGFGTDSTIYTENAVITITLAPYLWLIGRFCDSMADSIVDEAREMPRIDFIGMIVFTAGIPILLFVGTKIIGWVGRWGAIIGVLAIPFEILVLDTFTMVPKLLQYWAATTALIVIGIIFSPRILQRFSETTVVEQQE